MRRRRCGLRLRGVASWTVACAVLIPTFSYHKCPIVKVGHLPLSPGLAQFVHLASADVQCCRTQVLIYINSCSGEPAAILKHGFAVLESREFDNNVTWFALLLPHSVSSFKVRSQIEMSAEKL